MKNIIINILDLFHLLLAFFLMTGGYIIPNKYIPLFLLCTPYLVIDWNDTDGSCWITKLRNMIKYKSIYPKVKNELENNFLNSLVRKLGITIKSKTFTFILYILIFASWFYAYIRLTNQYNIKILPNDITKYIVYFMIISWILITLPSLKNI